MTGSVLLVDCGFLHLIWPDPALLAKKLKENNELGQGDSTPERRMLRDRRL